MVVPTIRDDLVPGTSRLVATSSSRIHRIEARSVGGDFPTAYEQTKHCGPEKKINYYTVPFSKIPPMDNPPEEGTPAGATSSPTAPAPDPARQSPAATRDVAQDADFGDDQ